MDNAFKENHLCSTLKQKHKFCLCSSFCNNSFAIKCLLNSSTLERLANKVFCVIIRKEENATKVNDCLQIIVRNFFRKEIDSSQVGIHYQRHREAAISPCRALLMTLREQSKVNIIRNRRQNSAVDRPSSNSGSSLLCQMITYFSFSLSMDN